jgi:hypothetical protein
MSLETHSVLLLKIQRSKQHHSAGFSSKITFMVCGSFLTEAKEPVFA